MLKKLTRLSRRQKLLAGALVIAILYTIIGFGVLPLIAKSVLADKLSLALKRDVIIEKVSINPYALTVRITGIEITGKDGTRFASFEEFFVNLQAWSAVKRALVLSELRITRPYARIVRREESSFNFDDLLAKGNEGPSGTGDEAEKAPKFFRFILENVDVNNGKIDFDDRFATIDHSIEGISFVMSPLSSLPADKKTEVAVRLSATINGAKVKVAAKSTPFDDSLKSNVQFEIAGLSIPHYLSYVSLPESVRIMSASLSTSLSLFYAQKDGKVSLMEAEGKVSLTETEVLENKDSPLIKIPAIEIDLARSSILKRELHFNSVVTTSPELNIRRLESGAVNLENILKAAENSGQPKNESPNVSSNQKPAAGNIKILVDHMRVEAAKILFTDFSFEKPFILAIDPATLSIDNFSTAEEKEASFKVDVKTKRGESFHGEGTFSLARLRSEGVIAVKEIALPAYNPFLEDYMQFEVTGGKLDVETTYSYGDKETDLPLKLTKTDIWLKSLSLKDTKTGEEFLSIPEFFIKNVEMDMDSRALTLGIVGSKDVTIRCHRTSEGEINLQKLFALPPESALQASPEKKPVTLTPWSVDVKKVDLKNYAVSFKDQVPSETAEILLDKINLRAGELTTRKGKVGRIDLDMRYNSAGSIRVGGSVVLQPFSADMSLDLADMDIRSMQPYFTDKVKLIVTDGSLMINGNARMAFGEKEDPDLRFSGKVEVNRFASIDKKEANDFVNFESLYVSGIDFQIDPLKIIIDEVALTGYYSSLIINPDGTINLNTIVPRKQNKEDVSGESELKKKKGEVGDLLPEIRINTINMQGGHISFSDHLMKPNIKTELTKLGGRISGLSSEKTSQADIFIQGVQGNSAPLEIKGKINPLSEDLYVDVKLSFKEMELSPFSPYSSKYIGYILEKGMLNLDLMYKIEGNSIKAENHVYIDQLTLGDKVESPDATSLPVKLAISLLKDRNDRIKIDMPVEGDLDDPGFSIGPVVLKMLFNLMKKIITSPFAAIGAMFGGQEELSYVDFEHGSHELNDTARKKLKALSKALYDRPKLSIDIQGSAGSRKDREILRNLRFENLLRAEKRKEIGAKGWKTSALEQKVAPEERGKYIDMAYDAAGFLKPRDASGKIKVLPSEEKEKLLFTNIFISDDNLRLLAHKRASMVKAFFIEKGLVESERLFIVEPASFKDEEESLSRVHFTLK